MLEDRLEDRPVASVTAGIQRLRLRQCSATGLLRLSALNGGASNPDAGGRLVDQQLASDRIHEFGGGRCSSGLGSAAARPPAIGHAACTGEACLSCALRGGHAFAEGLPKSKDGGTADNLAAASCFGLGSTDGGTLSLPSRVQSLLPDPGDDLSDRGPSAGSRQRQGRRACQDAACASQTTRRPKTCPRWNGSCKRVR